LWRKDPSLQISKDILIATARNGYQAVEVFQFLWRKDASLYITEDVLVAAV
jgi:hypothetical protein